MYSILEFCEFAGISRSTYYNLKKCGDGPCETRILGRIGVNKQTADTWLKAQESKTTEAKAA